MRPAPVLYAIMAQLALQLYTVRNDLKKDFVGTLRQVAKMGYTGIEGGGTGPLTPEQFRSLMSELKLIPIGAHVGRKALSGPEREKSLELFRGIGTKFLAVSEFLENPDAWAGLGRELSDIGKATAARGITFQYHNHAHEFQQHNGKVILDILLDNADPAVVGSQLDVGWVQRAGEDPVAWMDKLGRRIRTLHLKDTTEGGDPQWTEIGNGSIDLPAIHAAARKLGIDWYIVEQDTCDKPPLESAAISFENTRKATS